MTHAHNSSRSERLLSYLLDILCGRSYDDDNRARVLGMLMAIAVMIPVTFVLFYMKEITYFLLPLFL